MSGQHGTPRFAALSDSSLVAVWGAGAPASLAAGLTTAPCTLDQAPHGGIAAGLVGHAALTYTSPTAPCVSLWQTAGGSASRSPAAVTVQPSGLLPSSGTKQTVPVE